MSEIRDFFPVVDFCGYVTGDIAMFATETAPSGFLECDGTTLSINNYNGLFNIIGTKYGGNGTTTFRVPDYRGLFLRGRDDGGGYDPDINLRTLNPYSTGNRVGSEQGQEIDRHSHRGIIDSNSSGGVGWYDLNPTPSWDNPLHGNSVNYPVSSSGGGETRPMNYAMVFVIKY